VNPLVKRQRAIAATMERFRGKPFAFGSVDCAKVVAFHLKQLGHKVRLSKAGQYRTLLGAQAALRRLGYDTLSDAMDGHGFARVAPAAALLGDIISYPTDHPIGALGIVINGGNSLCFHADHELLVVLAPTAEATRDAVAWSVMPPAGSRGQA
jgi:hypothetical protein